ncbi:MAG: purine-nucleoside phosphorylase [Anaerovoracaceae bacterium]
MSTHINAASRGDIAESVLLPGDPLRARYIAENYLEEPVCYSDVRNMYGYTGRYRGVPVSVQGTGMGMPSMGIYSWELITAYGCQNLIRIGTAGSFREELKMGDIVCAIAASTDSNYRHAFDVPEGYAAAASWELLTKAYEISRAEQVPLTAGNVVSCDVFYETVDGWWKKWANMNVLAVEMEAAALYLNAAYHNVNALAMMTVTDHFVTGETATIEQRQHANDAMLELALKVAVS